MGKIAALCLALGLAAPACTLAASDPARPAGTSIPRSFRSSAGARSVPFAAGACWPWPACPARCAHFYFGGVNGGVWETNDAGRTWRPIFDAQPIGSIGALALAPSNPKVIYVGTGEADMRSDIAQGDGMYKSTDGGKTLPTSGLATRSRSGASWSTRATRIGCWSRLSATPTAPTPSAASFSPATAAGSGSGCSTATRTPARSISRSSRAIPASCTRLSGRRAGRPGTFTRRPTGPGSGLYKSTDGGGTWTEIRGRGFPANPGRIGLAVAPSRPDRVYAMVDAEQRRALPLRRRRRELDAHERRSADLGTRLVLRRDHGRAARRRRRLRGQHVALPVAGRRAVRSRRSRALPAGTTTTSSGSTPSTPSAACSASTRARSCL